MAEEAQELTVTNAGQPQTVDIRSAEQDEEAQELTASMPTALTVEIDPATD